jgi:voltage-gated potassium channel Kch
MTTNIAIGLLMAVVTTAVHASFMVITLKALKAHAQHRGTDSFLGRMSVTSGCVLLMFAASLIEVALWAAAYLILGAISSVEKALYFSGVTFTTLGYGDVLLEAHWRLLGPLEAANGIIMFGWTTAIVIAVVQRVYFSDKSAQHR